MIEKDEIQFPLLTSEDIEVKVKQITKAGALLLLYKTARVDAKILDATVGVMNWECRYEEIHDNLYCGIGVRQNPKEDFVWKWDCGIESGQDDGQEKKAEASDAFKRAASRLGIGRELYTSPQIWADVATVQKGDKWYLEDPYAKYVVTKIKFNTETRVMTELEIQNVKSGVVVFDWTLKTSGAMGKKMVKTVGKASQEQTVEVSTESISKEADNFTTIADATEKLTETKPTLLSLVREIGSMVKVLTEKQGSAEAYRNIVKEVTGDVVFKCNTATEAQYDIVLAIRDKMLANGYGI